MWIDDVREMGEFLSDPASKRRFDVDGRLVVWDAGEIERKLFQ